MEISVIIATYNSGRLLPMVLDALDRQDYPREQVEVLIVDGGSTDDTRQLAQSRGCRVIDNPRTEPVYAKFLGLNAARGRYVVFLDHDEVIESRGSLRLKRQVFDAAPEIHVVLGAGYKNPNPENVVNEYINEFGDPFSFFMYRLSKGSDYFLPTLRSRYVCTENALYVIVDFEGARRMPLIEPVAIGTMIDRQFFLNRFPELSRDERPIGHLFYLMLTVSTRVAVTKDDFLLHYSSETWPKFLAKIRWRVKNNVFFTSATGAAGFHGRKQFESGWARHRQVLYPFYAFLILPALADAIWLAVTRGRIRYLTHFPLTLFTATYICWQLLLRSIGHAPRQRNYDESKTIGTGNDRA